MLLCGFGVAVSQYSVAHSWPGSLLTVCACVLRPTCRVLYVVVAGRKRGERFHGRVAGAIVLEQVCLQYLCTYATRRTNCCLSAANRLPLATSARRAPAEGPKMVDITVQVH